MKLGVEMDTDDSKSDPTTSNKKLFSFERLDDAAAAILDPNLNVIFGDGGRIAQWLAFLLPDTAALGSSHNSGVFWMLLCLLTAQYFYSGQ